MKRLLTFFVFTLFSSNLLADCMKVSDKNIKVNWTAFKTLSKIGVGGSFSKIKLKSKTKGTSIKDILYGHEFIIDTHSVQTGNESRDKKIAAFFFGGTKEIQGAVSQITEKVLELTLTMNNVTKKVPLEYSILGNELKAKGTIDIFDFNMNSSLIKLNEACHTLHEGKTWNDVTIELTTNFEKC